VFAVTQLSHHLLHDPTIIGALQTALLLAMVWLVWATRTCPWRMRRADQPASLSRAG